MGRPTANVLVVDDDEAIREIVRRTLEDGGARVAEASSADHAAERMEKRRFDVVVLDLSMPGMNGMEFLRTTRDKHKNTEFIILTAHATISNAVAAMRHGAFDFLEKPFDTEKLLMLALRAAKLASLADENTALRAASSGSLGAPEIVTQDPAMRETIELAESVAASDSPVLLLGETGTGKELLARLIHARSRAAAGPFLPINCTAMQESLFESELFGYEKGAFTGAMDDRGGLLEAASGGSLMLDEIGDMSPLIQGKLLRVLETGDFRRVGSAQLRHTEARIIAATNRDLMQAIREDRFRRDLYFRLNTLTVSIPPLRDRKGDTRLLALHFLRESAARYNKSIADIEPEAMRALEEHPWPGNVRELLHVIDRAALLCKGKAIAPRDLSGLQSSESSVEEMLKSKPTLDELEKAYILRTLQGFGGRREKTAEALGISIRTLRRRLRDYGVARDEDDESDEG
ncbi:MAG TPA: sigma-54 dependent transcriptional regulator [Candidatus Brocadiia bacterium]|nr:sigma-54 dependent transcriptional regulator [Candidatus Brocadiia bacterium]